MTEANARVIAVSLARDTAPVDVTEGVLALYDMVRASLDWSSGFYTADDLLPVLRLARALNLSDLPDVKAYVAELERQEAAIHDADGLLFPPPTPKVLVPSEALAVLAPDEERVVEQHFDAPPVKEQVRTGPTLPTGTPSAYLQE